MSGKPYLKLSTGKILLLGILVIIACACYMLCTSERLYVLALSIARPQDPVELSRLEQILTPGRMDMIRIGLPMVLLGSGALFIAFSQAIGAGIRSIIQEARMTRAAYTSHLRSMPRVAHGVLVIYLIIAGWLAFDLPIHHDEAYTFMYYIDRGPFTSIVLYNSTNNHVLYSVLASFIGVIPGSTVTLLRVFQIAFGGCFLLYTYVRLLRMFSTKVALTGMFLLMSLQPFLYYATHARGYLLYAFFAAVATFSMVDMIQGKLRKSNLFTASTVLGAFTIPTYIYAFIAHIGAGVLFGKSAKPFARILVMVGVGVGLLYLPIFVLNGWDAVHQNEQLGQLATVNSFSLVYLKDLVQEFGHPYLYLAGLLLPGTMMFLDKDRKKVYVLVLLMFVIPPFIPLFQGFNPPGRVFIYLVIPLVLVVCATLRRASNFMLGVVIILNSICLVFNIQRIYRQEVYPSAIAELQRELLASDTSRIYVHGYSSLRGALLYYNRKTPVSIDYSRFGDQFDPQLLTQGYDLILTHEHIDCPGYVESKSRFWWSYEPEK